MGGWRGMRGKEKKAGKQIWVALLSKPYWSRVAVGVARTLAKLELEMPQGPGISCRVRDVVMVQLHKGRGFSEVRCWANRDSPLNEKSKRAVSGQRIGKYKVWDRKLILCYTVASKCKQCRQVAMDWTWIGFHQSHEDVRWSRQISW